MPSSTGRKDAGGTVRGGRGKARPSERASAASPSELRSLVVAVDLSAISDRVLGRVALLPLAADARVTLVHVAPSSASAAERRRTMRAAKDALAQEADHLRKQLPATVLVESVARDGTAAAEITAVAEELSAQLVVMGRGGSRAVRDAFLGSTAERVIRAALRPVLAVRLSPRAAYARPAAAVDLDASASGVIAWILRVLGASGQRIEVIHALATPFEGRAYSGAAPEDVAERRAELRRAAADALAVSVAQGFAMVGGRPAPPKWTLHLQQGAPRTAVPAAVERGRVDILALGTRGASGLSQAFIGSVAGDLLRSLTCDVLMVPPAATRTAECRRNSDSDH